MTHFYNPDADEVYQGPKQEDHHEEATPAQISAYTERTMTIKSEDSRRSKILAALIDGNTVKADQLRTGK